MKQNEDSLNRKR